MINQNWTMFAPRVRSESGWFVVHGERRDGTKINLLNPGAPADERKETFCETQYFKNGRKKNFLRAFKFKNTGPLHASFAKYLCRQWNLNHGSESGLRKVEIIWMKRSPTGFEDWTTLEKKILYEKVCSE
jgi:hypothetical protein